jgi:hypothetical protein
LVIRLSFTPATIPADEALALVESSTRAAPISSTIPCSVADVADATADSEP